MQQPKSSRNDFLSRKIGTADHLKPQRRPGFRLRDAGVYAPVVGEGGAEEDSLEGQFIARN